MTLKNQITTRTQEAEQLRLRARKPSTDPRLAHEAGVAAERLGRDVEKLREYHAGNAALILRLQELIRYLENSPHKSVHRSLALRHLEDAQSRLMRENGD